MNKVAIRVIALFLCGALLLSLALSVFATESVDGEQILIIETRQDFLDFAENCRLDTYSENLTVLLYADIDLTGTNFAGIPTFSGSFGGNDHTITLELSGEGSYQGLFRYLTETATVSALNVCARVTPGGTKSCVGGIAGCNAGRIEKCTVTDGTVSGTDYIGGIAGVNTATGVIADCAVYGSVHGVHFAGGVAGSNDGKIENCINYAQINATTEQNKVDLSDITIDNLTGTESSATVTDLGGIVGTSSGTVTGCINHGAVGYQYMGYNVGGIAGTQSGYLAECINYGNVQGRKEVGGIVGQLEPQATISFSTDTLQILQEQLDELELRLDKTTAHADENIDTVKSLLTTLDNYKTDIESTSDSLTAIAENPTWEDLERIPGLIQRLTDDIEGIATTVDSLYDAVGDTLTQLESDLESVTQQVDVLSSTLDNASSNLGGSLTDISDNDTEDDKDSKVASCQNFGKVKGDLNIGGIVGAIAMESDLDPEEDVDITGDDSLNYAVDARAVIRSCTNNASVSARKQLAGGIVGWMSMGLAKDCINTGAVDASAADYVGGICGKGSGYIRTCHAKCALAGDTYVGGIAGSAPVVSDCFSMIDLTAGSEKLGCIIGYTDDREDITGNYYLPVGQDRGGIDGISYGGCAEPKNQEQFLASDGISDVFRVATLYFVLDDTRTAVEVELGAAVTSDQLPQLPTRDGYVASWDGLDTQKLSAVYFDAVYTAQYSPVATVIASSRTYNGAPVLMAQGSFEKEETFQVENMYGLAPSSAGMVSVWQYDLPEGAVVTAMRCQIPDGYTAEDLIVSVRDSRDYQWREVSFTVRGNYLVFEVTDNDDAIALTEASDTSMLWVWIVVGVAVCGAVVASVTVLVKKRRKK